MESDMHLNDMAVVETTYEAIRGEFAYRVTITTEGGYIKRTKAARPAWTHGVLCEGYDGEAQTFLPMVQLTKGRLPHPAAEAVLATL